jgi:YidC/Oxa1 family membrane protein insertase
MEQRNLLLAIVLSVAILLSFELLYYGPQNESQGPEQTTESTARDGGGPATQPQAQGDDTAPDATASRSAGMPDTGGAQAQAPTRDQVLAGDDNRIRIDTPKVTGSIALNGGRIDDITLKTYRRELDPESEQVHVLSPKGSREAYYAAFGWSGVAGTGIELPTPDTQWSADGDRLSPGNDVTLSWTNPVGITFERVYSIDRDYMVTVTQRVTNNAEEAISLAPYGLISRRGTPEVSRLYILHEGPLGVLEGTLDEYDYGDLQDEGIIANDTQGGWIGITDKYWLASLVPDQDAQVKTRFVHSDDGGVNKYQTDILYDTKRIEPGATVSQTSRVFAGAKEVAVLDRYKEELGVPMFDKAVDFGWFYFLNKPLFQVLMYFQNLTGNFGIAIFMLVVCIKIVFFPLANKSYRSMAKLRKLQPEMQRLREQFGDDKQRLNQEMMALYKQEGANPASGCLPILIQIPVFFALYKVLLVTIEMRHAPFFAWIQDLSAKDPTAITNLFGLMPWGVPELGPLNILNIGVLPIFMGFTMYAQQLLNPQPADPTQAKIFKLLPVFFTFILGQFPAGLVLYWTSNNVLTAAQQYLIMKRAGDKPGQKSAAPPPKPQQQKSGGNKTGGGGASGTGSGNGAADPSGDGEADSAGGPAPVPAGAAANAANTGVGEAAAGATPAAGGSSNPAAKSAKGKGKGKKGRKR